MLIAISGKSGCGNTTVSRLTAERLSLPFVNFTFRSLAAEQGISLEEVLRLAAVDDWWDREVDRRQTALARAGKEGCVLGSRLAIWLLKDAGLKVYLKAREETRVSRIMRREGGSYEETAAFTRRRDAEDHARYLRLYNIDNDAYEKAADMVIDTDDMLPERIASLITERASAQRC